MASPPPPTQSTTTNPATRAAHTSRQEAAGRAAELRADIALHDHRYYVLDAPVIADEDDERFRAELGRRQLPLVAEPKYDGISVELIYEDGVLRFAGTRGDGRTGEDVTANVRTIREVALRLRPDSHMPRRLVARGEVYVPGIAAWFRDDRNRALLAELTAHGATPARPPPTTPDGVGLSTDTLTSNA